MSNVLAENGADSKPICHGSPRPLLELASMKVALTIWVTKFDEFYPSMNDSPKRIHQLNFSTELSITVPKKIQNMIDATLPLILWELQRWAGYIKDVQNNLTKHQIYTRFKLVAFGGNGTVNFKASVANFLEDDSLDNMTRFEIACVNCVEEKVDHFWPLVCCNLRIDNFQFDNDFMMYYWICRKEGKLDQIPLGEFNSIEHLMMDRCRNKFMYLALEYFFISLNPNDQLVELEKLLNPDMDRRLVENELQKYEENGCFTHLFPNIDGPMQRLILDKYTTRILYPFVECLKPAEYVIRCFLYFRDIIIPQHYFKEVIEKIVISRSYRLVIHQYCGSSDEEERFLYKHIELTLQQIWFHTPLNLKKYTLNHFSDMEIYNISDFNLHLRGFRRDITFLLTMLSDADIRTRNNLWNNEWDFWIEGVPPSQFEELMGLCLMKPEAIEKFKNTLLNSQTLRVYFYKLIFKGCFIESDEFLISLYPNQDLVMKIKKNFFAYNSHIFNVPLENMDIQTVVNYIDSSFPNDVLAADFKDQLISSDSTLKNLLRRILDGDFHDVKSILSLFASPQKHTEIKIKFLELFRDRITSGEFRFFNGSFCNEFLTWCTNSREQLDDFMKSLQIDAVFETAFSGCLRHLPDGEDNLILLVSSSQWNDVINSLNRFLRWYFNESENVSESYVREKVEYYERMDAAEVERIFGRDKQIAIGLMRNGLLENSSAIS